MSKRTGLSHIFLSGVSSSEKYSSPWSGFSGKRFPSRSRRTHARQLIANISSVVQEEKERVAANNLSGTTIEIVGKSGYDLKIDSLENKRKGVELLNVRTLPNNEQAATVYLPKENINYFSVKVNEYKDKDKVNRNKNTSKPANNDLVRSIEAFRVSTVRAFYTDDLSFFPKDENEKRWWEIWINSDDDNIQKYLSSLQQKNIKFNSKYLKVANIVIFAVFASLSDLAEQVKSQVRIREIRIGRDVVYDFYKMKGNEQKEWVDDLNKRLNLPSEASPFISILDTGVNRLHPLISPVLDVKDWHTVVVGKGPDDTHSHGTAMCGLAIYGKIDDALQSKNNVNVPAKIESVNIFQTTGSDLEVFGNVTKEAIGKLEATRPDVDRVVCLAISYPGYKHHGKPSSWSAAIDEIAVGNYLGRPLLFIVAGGNIADNPLDYPNDGQVASIHDPAQSWNAVTVGYFAHKNQITEKEFENWTAIAPVGGLGPTATSSLTWNQKKWPIKPDVVLDGGNFAINEKKDEALDLHSLQLLTLSHESPKRHFHVTGESSAAAALLSRMAAEIYRQYPGKWPETVRALLIHSARWTSEMMSMYSVDTKRARENLLRMVGYGVPNLTDALNSVSNDLALVIEDTIFPFTTDGKMNELRIHKLPWPRQELEKLGGVPVTMKVTLSYFVEPDPSDRGWDYKYQYRSHGLRFEVKKPDETDIAFKARINKASRAEEDDSSYEGDSEKWYFGHKIRSKGSVHSDYWVNGTAAELALREYIAIFPTSGWWKIKEKDRNHERSARYSLVISISTPDETIDLYNMVETVVSVSAPVSIEI